MKRRLNHRARRDAASQPQPQPQLFSPDPTPAHRPPARHLAARICIGDLLSSDAKRPTNGSPDAGKWTAVFPLDYLAFAARSAASRCLCRFYAPLHTLADEGDLKQLMSSCRSRKLDDHLLALGADSSPAIVCQQTHNLFVVFIGNPSTRERSYVPLLSASGELLHHRH